MEQPKPIKRSKELVPLSKEHHEGLLFGWKIKQGISNGTDTAAISSFIQWFWENDLKEHFRKEEQVLAAHLPKHNEWVQQMFADHAMIEALVHKSHENPDQLVFGELADKVHDHIRFEERTLFPFAEKTIPGIDLQAMHADLAETKEKTEWKHEFWVNKKSK